MLLRMRRKLGLIGVWRPWKESHPGGCMYNEMGLKPPQAKEKIITMSIYYKNFFIIYLF
jgi:hypothetical protein